MDKVTIAKVISDHMKELGSRGGKARGALPADKLSKLGRKAGKASGKARKRAAHG